MNQQSYLPEKRQAQSLSYLLLSSGVSSLFIKECCCLSLEVLEQSREFANLQEIKLARWGQGAHTKIILADFNLAVSILTAKAKFNSPLNFPAIRVYNIDSYLVDGRTTMIQI